MQRPAVAQPERLADHVELVRGAGERLQAVAGVTELIRGLPDAPAETAEPYLGRLAGRLAL